MRNVSAYIESSGRSYISDAPKQPVYALLQGKYNMLVYLYKVTKLCIYIYIYIFIYIYIERERERERGYA